MTLPPLLSIENLSVRAGETPILKSINLTIGTGEIHVLLGANGAGKSTLGHLLVGKPSYEVTQGKVQFVGESLLEMSPETRVHHGLFMAFQQPVGIPGVSNLHFLKAAINATREARGLVPWKVTTCLAQIKPLMQRLGMDLSFLQRSVNDDFSGGEKKRNELLQMTLLKPKLIILDETDSGLDRSARQRMREEIQRMRTAQQAFLIITHYQELLVHITPDAVHEMHAGTIVRTGDTTLATEILTTTGQPST